MTIFNRSIALLAVAGLGLAIPVFAAAPSLSSLTLKPTSVTGGQASLCTVTLNLPAPPGGTLVYADSSPRALVTVPSPITVLAGKTSATFPLPTNAPAATTSVQIMAACGGVLRVTSLTVNAAAKPPAPPPAPAGLIATAGISQVSLAWNPSAGATGYKILRSLVPGGPFASLNSGILGLSYVDGGLANGTIYYYVVLASNAAGDSLSSNQVNATPTAALPVPDLGINASLNGRRPFPADNPWNQRIDTAPVDPNSNNLIASIGLTTNLHPDFGASLGGAPFGIPYVVVPGSQPLVPVAFYYADESDPGPYPIPPNAPIEDGPQSSGDRHVLVLDRDHWKLYETFSSYPNGTGGWNAGSGAIFDLSSDALRPAGWTSADAAGLPVFPGLVRYDEVVDQGVINHALRFTVQHSRKGYVAPARHFASSNPDPNLPPMGMRVRLKAGFDVSRFPPEARVILQALKSYGMFVADNGSNWYVSGAPDARWNDGDLNTLKGVPGSSFEVVQMGPVVTQ